MRSTLGHWHVALLCCAFCETARRIIRGRSATRAKAAIVSLISTAAAVCAPQHAQAHIIVATITGTVLQGYVLSSNTGKLFGLPPGASLKNQKYKFVFTIDDKKGTGTVFTGNPPYGSSISATYADGVVTSNPLTAVLTINGQSYAFGTQSHTSVLLSSTGRVCALLPCTAIQVQFTNMERYTSPYEGEDQYTINFGFNVPRANVSPDWESPLSLVFTKNFPAGSDSIFELGRTLTDPRTGNVISSVGAYAMAAPNDLSISSFTITGPSQKPPDIIFNGDKITGKTTPVFVGQPIQLSADPPQATDLWQLDDPRSGTSLSWTDVAVANFDVNGCPSLPQTPKQPLKSIPNCTGIAISLEPPFTTSSTPRFYWVRPGLYRVDYYYDGLIAPVSATFAVKAPAPVVPVKIGKVSSIKGGIALTGVPVGNGSQAGIQFGPPNPRNEGRFEWVQLIAQFTYQANYFKDGVSGTSSCTLGSGLDNSYPYYNSKIPVGYEGAAFDGPSITPDTATQKYDSVDWQFSANMYLMWSPAGTSDTIFVPLGYVPWSFSAEATQSAGSWKVDGFPPFQPAFVGNSPTGAAIDLYPQWDDIVIKRIYIPEKGKYSLSTLSCSP